MSQNPYERKPLPPYRTDWTRKGIDAGFVEFVRGILAAINPKTETYRGDAIAYIIHRERFGEQEVIDQRWEDYQERQARAQQKPGFSEKPGFSPDDYDPNTPEMIAAREQALADLKRKLSMGGE